MMGGGGRGQDSHGILRFAPGHVCCCRPIALKLLLMVHMQLMVEQCTSIDAVLQVLEKYEDEFQFQSIHMYYVYVQRTYHCMHKLHGMHAGGSALRVCTFIYVHLTDYTCILVCTGEGEVVQSKPEESVVKQDPILSQPVHCE